MIIFWIILAVVALFGLTVLFGAPYVPSRRDDLANALQDVYKPSPKDLLLDIGSGDGVVLRAVAKHGANAVGYEINPVLALISWWLCRKQPNIQTKLANFWYTDFPDGTTHVYVFGESRDIKRITKRVQAETNRLDHPILVLSYGFQLPGRVAVRQSKTHFLYKFSPSQTK